MKNLLQIILVLLLSFQAHSQEKIITGTISDENGLPLPGVNIIIKGTTNGTQTDFDGNYIIKAHVGDILTFSYLGYLSEEKVIGGSDNISFYMQIDSSAIEEVVITAYGIRRSKPIKIKGISAVKEETVVKSLSGKVSGLSIGKSDDNLDLVRYSEPQSGQLTAGEINDLEKWDEWLKALKSEQSRIIQNNWSFYLESKILVSINNSEGQPMNNVKVTLFNDINEKIMTAKTDVNGNVYLFKDMNKYCYDEYFIIQVANNNEVFGKKIMSRQNEINFILNSNKTSEDIDVMFTIDATGSMADEINYLKSELKNIISRLDKKINKKRVALTFYRDKGDDYIVKDFDFSDDIDEVKEILSNQYADGGGDYEEAVEQALRVSMSKEWNINAKSRLLFLLLDAPPHLNEENVYEIKEQIKIAQEKGIKIIPIVASGANKDVEFLMRFFSVSTNGTYVFLTDDSGIGNPHLKPTATSYEIEKLNDLIVRLIEKYSGIV